MDSDDARRGRADPDSRKSPTVITAVPKIGKTL